MKHAVVDHLGFRSILEHRSKLGRHLAPQYTPYLRRCREVIGESLAIPPGVGPVFRPNLFVDVSTTIEAKVRAMQLYSGELSAFPRSRSSEALRAIAGRCDSVAGVDAAEAVELIRAVP